MCCYAAESHLQSHHSLEMNQNIIIINVYIITSKHQINLSRMPPDIHLPVNLLINSNDSGLLHPCRKGDNCRTEWSTGFVEWSFDSTLDAHPIVYLFYCVLACYDMLRAAKNLSLYVVGPHGGSEIKYEVCKLMMQICLDYLLFYQPAKTTQKDRETG